MADETPQLSESEKKKEDWMNSKWRPMMGWMYMSVCAFDFMIILSKLSHLILHYFFVLVSNKYLINYKLKIKI